MLNNVTTTILHLSDMHLGANFGDVGSTNKAEGLSKETINSFIKHHGVVMQTHDSWIIPGLETEILAAARYIRAPDDRFDFHVITGDISTDVYPPERFQFARDYLVDSVPLDPSPQSKQVGLRLPPESVICVPGNHDKMALPDCKPYLAAFSDLPAEPPYAIQVQSRSGQSLLFFGIDSNLYTRGNIAVGRITPETLAQLNEFLTLSEEPNMLTAIKILVLHHHPADLNKFRSFSVKKLLSLITGAPFSVLKEGNRLLKACNGRIDLIMHGHEHFPIVFHESISSAIIISAGTSSSFMPKGKGTNTFHTIALAQRDYEIVQFNWNGARFLPEKSWSGNLDNPRAIRAQRLTD